MDSALTESENLEKLLTEEGKYTRIREAVARKELIQNMQHVLRSRKTGKEVLDVYIRA